MSRLSFGLVLIVGILAGGLGVSLLDRGPAPLERRRRAQHRRRDAGGRKGERRSARTRPRPTQRPRSKTYLMGDPAILERMSAKLSAAKKVAQREAQARLIAANYAAIYDDAGNVVLGNPDGDVTLVEMFDYNCGYCRRRCPTWPPLMAEDPNLRIILKEFPILSDGSVEAAKIAVLVAEDDRLDYWDVPPEALRQPGPGQRRSSACGGRSSRRQPRYHDDRHERPLARRRPHRQLRLWPRRSIFRARRPTSSATS